MQPQPKQQSAQQAPNPMQATAGALQKAKQAPAGPQPTQPQQPGQQGGQDDFSSEITANLEQHLNSLDPRQKKFLADSLQHYANIVIPCLGIVCGQEVFQYFTQLYQQNFAKGAGQQNPNQQPNSAPNNGQQNSSPNPQGMPQGQPQGQPPAQQAQPAQQLPQQ